MHDEQVEIDDSSLRLAIDRQFPNYGRLPLRRLASDGTVNAVFRLGNRLVVRVPIIEWGAADAAREADVLPRLRGAIPVAVPEFVAIGEEAPDLGIPWKWSVLGWIEGERAFASRLSDPNGVADTYAGVLASLARTSTVDAPKSLATGQARDNDDETRSMIARTRGLADDRAILRAWEAALAVPDSNDLGTSWIHGDPTPGNLIMAGGRLTAIIDWSSAGVGDVAHDLIAAWWLLPQTARRRLRAGIDIDEATWARGRAKALKKAIYALPYYSESNPGLASDARFALDQIVEEMSQRRPL